MTKTISTDVLVVGLGPAGSRAAAAAARGGCSVLAVDRKRQAGAPVQCAEFVPALLTQEMKGLDRVAWQRIRSMATFVEKDPADIEPNFPGWMIDRRDFDASLVETAKQSGADCRFGIRLETLLPKGMAVLSDGSSVATKIIIGCDGPRSRIGRAIGQFNKDLVETRQMTIPLLKPHDATDIFLSASIPGGYAWLFPKGDVANLGIGLVPWAKRQLKPLLQNLHETLIRERRVGAEILAHTGGAIPVGGMLYALGRYWNTPVLLAGDAAGLTNPVTGAGITAAVISGDLAGRAAAEWLNGKTDVLENYAEEIHDLFAPALNRALRRRKEMLERFLDGKEPTSAALRRGWIAYPEYWAA